MPLRLERPADNAHSGLFSFASTTLILSLYNAGVRGVVVPNVVVGMAMGVGGLAQLLAGMWEFAAGNTFGATGERTFLSISSLDRRCFRVSPWPLFFPFSSLHRSSLALGSVARDASAPSSPPSSAPSGRTQPCLLAAHCLFSGLRPQRRGEVLAATRLISQGAASHPIWACGRNPTS